MKLEAEDGKLRLTDAGKEKEADNFAVRRALSEEEQEEILQCQSITENDVVEFSKKSAIRGNMF